MAQGTYDLITVGGGLGGATLAKVMAERETRVLVLERDRLDQIGPSDEDAGSLRAADRLAAAEGDQIGTLRDEAPQVLDWWQRGGGVDDDRQAVPAADLGHRLEWDDAPGDPD